MSTPYKPAQNIPVPDWAKPVVENTTPKPTSSTSPTGTTADYTELARRISQEEGFDENITLAVMKQESAGRQKALSPKGAGGLMQLMPDTAKDLGVTDIFDPEQNVRGGVRYLKQLYDKNGGDLDKTLASYNWGMGNLQRKGLENAPKETRNYIKNIRQTLGTKAPPSTNDSDIPEWDDLVSGKASLSAPTAMPTTSVTSDDEIPEWDDLVSGKIALPKQSPQPTQAPKPIESFPFKQNVDGIKAREAAPEIETIEKGKIPEQGKGYALTLNLGNKVTDINRVADAAAAQLGFRPQDVEAFKSQFGRHPLAGALASPTRPGQPIEVNELNQALEQGKGYVNLSFRPGDYIQLENFIKQRRQNERLPEQDQSAAQRFLAGTGEGMTLGNVRANINQQQDPNYGNAGILQAAKDILPNAETIGNIVGTTAVTLPAMLVPGLGQAAIGDEILGIAGREALAGSGLLAPSSAASQMLARSANSAGLFGTQSALTNPTQGDAADSTLGEQLVGRTKAGIEGVAKGAFFPVVEGANPNAVKTLGAAGTVGTTERVLFDPRLAEEGLSADVLNEALTGGATDALTAALQEPVNRAVRPIANRIEQASITKPRPAQVTQADPTKTAQPQTEPVATPESILKPREANVKLTPEQDKALQDAETEYNNTLTFIDKFPNNVKADNKRKGQALRKLIATKKKILGNYQVERTGEGEPQPTPKAQEALPFDGQQRPVTSTPEPVISNSPLSTLPPSKKVRLSVDGKDLTGDDLRRFIKANKNVPPPQPKGQQDLPLEVANNAQKFEPIKKNTSTIAETKKQAIPEINASPLTMRQRAEELQRQGYAPSKQLAILREEFGQQTKPTIEPTAAPKIEPITTESQQVEQPKPIKQTKVIDQAKPLETNKVNYEQPRKTGESIVEVAKPQQIEQVKPLKEVKNAQVKENSDPSKTIYPPEVQANLDEAKARYAKLIQQADSFSGGDKKYASQRKSAAGFAYAKQKKAILNEYQNSLKAETKPTAAAAQNESIEAGMGLVKPRESHPILDKLISKMQDGQLQEALPNGEQLTLGKWLLKQSEQGKAKRIVKPGYGGEVEYVVDTPQGQLRIGAQGKRTTMRLENTKELAQAKNVDQSPGALTKPQQTKQVKPLEQPQNSQLGAVSQNSKPLVEPTLETVTRVTQPVAQGKTGKATTADGTKVDFVYEVVNINDLGTSHSNLLDPNPKYPAELQPRERDRAASELQINEIQNKLEPSWLTANPLASHGAPITGNDYNVESGNGRTIALRRLYEAKSQKAQEYKQYLIDNAKELGLDPEQIRNAEAPILIRKRTSEVDRVKFTREANKDTVARMSPFEQAKSDAGLLTEGMLNKFAPTEDGEILTAANKQDFIPSYFKNIIKSEQGGYLDSDGNINTDGIKRIKNSILMAAYGNTKAGNKILESIIESPDNNIKNIANGMLKAAPKLLELRRNKSELNITDDLMMAVNKLSALREQGQSVDDFLAQDTMFGKELTDFQENVLKALDTSKRSAGKVVKLLEGFASAAKKAEGKTKEGLFSDITKQNDDQLSLFQNNKGRNRKLYTPGQADNNQQSLVPETPKGITRASLRTTLLRTGLRDENGRTMNYKDLEQHIDKTLYIWDAMARSTGKDVDQFYQTAISEVRRSKGGADDKGATQFLENGQAILRLFDKADVSTFNHEMFHIFRRQLTSDEHATLNTWLEKVGAGKASGTSWNRTQEEFAARGFENFLTTGELPDNAPTKLQNAFYRVKEWMGNVYKLVENSPIPISGKIKKFFSEVQFDDPSANIFKKRLVEGSKQLEVDAKAQPKTANEGETRTRQVYESAQPYLDKPLSQILEPENYTKLTNKKAFEEANKLIASDPREALFLATSPQIEKGKAAIQNALSLELLRQAQANNEIGKAQSIIKALAARGTEAGQAAQILSNISRISPEGVVRYVDSQFTRLTDKISEGTRNKVEQVTKTLFDNINDTPEQLSLLFQKATGAPKPMLDKFTDKLGQAKTSLDREQVIREFVGKRYGVPTLTAEATSNITKMAKDLQSLQGYERKVAIEKLKQYISEQIPASVGKKLSFLLRAADLFNPGGGLMNTISDLAFSSPLGLEAATEQLASGVDYLGTKAGIFKERSLVRPKNIEQIKEFGKNLKISYNEIKQGIDTTGTTENALGLDASVPFNNKVAKFIDRSIKGLYGLTQQASYRTTLAESINNQMKAAEKNGKKLTEPTEEMIEQAVREAETRTLTDSNWLTRSLAKAKDALNIEKDFGVGTFTVTYTKVPPNLLLRGFEYSPLGVGKLGLQAIQAMRYNQSGGAKGREFNQREFVRNIARITLGTGITLGIGALLSRLGIILKQTDEKDESKKGRLQASEGLTGYRFNVSAMARFAQSGLKPAVTKPQANDTLINYEFLQPWAFLMNMGANLDKNSQKTTGEAWDVVKMLTKTGVDTIGDASVLQALNKAGSLGALTDTNRESDTVKQLVANLATRPIPALVRQARNYTDNTKRQTDDPSDGLIPIKTIVNRYIDSLPFASKTLPAQKTAFGQEQERTTGGTGFLRSFVTPGKVSNYKGTPEVEYAVKLFESRKEGDKRASHIPSAPRKLKVDGKEVPLTSDQRAKYQDLTGTATKDLYSRLMDNESFKQLSPDGQGEFIADYLGELTSKIKSQVLDTKLKPSRQRALANILPKDSKVLEHNIKVRVEEEKALSRIESDPTLKKLFDQLNESQQEHAISTIKKAYSGTFIKEDLSEAEGLRKGKFASSQATLSVIGKTLASKLAAAKAYHK